MIITLKPGETIQLTNLEHMSVAIEIPDGVEVNTGKPKPQSESQARIDQTTKTFLQLLKK